MKRAGKPTDRSRKQVPLTLPGSVSSILGDNAPALLEALRSPSPVSVRYNPCKTDTRDGTPVPWCATGRYLEQRPLFTLDPLFHAGCYYVQEASSMLLEQAFARTGVAAKDVLALDLCAAPGGKATHLASLLSKNSLLVCNEPDAHRRTVLSENVWKQGSPNTLITANDPSDLDALKAFFDLIVVDAPCSGQGMFRKDAFAREQWSASLVARCALIQKDILEHAWNALRPGGWLIYSTCTWERAENEEQVRELIAEGAEFIALELDASWGVVQSDLGYRCYPHLLKGEGFFISLLRKPGRADTRNASRTAHPLTELHQWLVDPLDRTVIIEKELAWAFPSRWSNEVARAREVLDVSAPGIPIAERKGDHWRPHPALALNELLTKGRFRAVELLKDHALAFLRGESLNLELIGGSSLPGEIARYVMFQHTPIGFIYPAGDRRWNNGWPKPWRIRMR